ncbi:MAG: ABC transporter substrate-binding protein [Sphingomonadales bacterium]|jgi:ABC-type Fe3+-hydroxamate transport system substrate-binding protein
MRQIVDQMGRILAVPDFPKKIVSLVPSQTELLYDLGLKDRIVGQTVFCVHPHEHFKSATKVGGTKKLNIQAIKDLQPDLIIGNKEENELSQIQELEKDFPVWMSDIYNLNDALQMIRKIGSVVNKHDAAEAIVHDIEAGFKEPGIPNNTSKNVLYFIWRKPYMVAGRNTFINDMMQYCGLENAISEKDSRYPEINAGMITSLKPDVIYLSSEPYPFKEKHIIELANLCPKAQIHIVDGEMFTWYGSRLLKTPQYFHELINSRL